MNEQNSGTKLCKYCSSEIPAGAKICPNCRKKQGKSGCLIAVIAVVVILVLVGIASGGGSDDKTSSSSSQGSTTAQSSSSATSSASSEETVTYTAYTVDEMMDDLNTNAMNASDKYKNQYIEITGKLESIDSDGKYISVLPENEEFAIIGVSCYIKSDEQKDVIKTKTMGDTITLRGKCTKVGDVLGYSLDIDSID